MYIFTKEFYHFIPKTVQRLHICVTDLSADWQNHLYMRLESLVKERKNKICKLTENCIHTTLKSNRKIYLELYSDKNKIEHDEIKNKNFTYFFLSK